MLVLKGLVGLHRTVQLQLLQRYWLGPRLGLLWYWMVCLGYEQRSFCHFWGCIQVLHFRLICWPWWPLHFFCGFPDSSVGKESTCNAVDPSLIPGLGRSAGEGIGYPLQYSWASLVAQLVTNLPSMRETWIQPLGWEDSLEKGKTTHSSILA